MSQHLVGGRGGGLLSPLPEACYNTLLLSLNLDIPLDSIAAGQDIMVYNGGESCDLNDRVHGISCRYSDKTSKQTYHTFLNTQRIFIKQSAHTS